MKKIGPWYTEDFDSMSWHDVHIHGFRFEEFNPDEGAADLVLDIDYILEWHKSEKEFLFTVCRAELRFQEVFRFKFMLDYATPTIGMCPFSIDGINREPLEFSTGFKSFRWQIPINCPLGSLKFEAPRFTLKLVGEPVVQSGQWLSPEYRGGGDAA
jgi:hypothetical protein